MKLTDFAYDGTRSPPSIVHVDVFVFTEQLALSNQHIQALHDIRTITMSPESRCASRLARSPSPSPSSGSPPPAP